MFITNPKFRSALSERLSALTPKPNEPSTPQPPRTNSGTPVVSGEGVVYLLKAGPFFKIGKAQDFSKRLRQIKLQLPYEVEAVHTIKCSDISHVERYWHGRFSNRRQNGEWFVLTAAEVAEFKSHATM